MKKIIPPTPSTPNMLHDLHTQMMNVVTLFRGQVCEECNWSIPTFYRKMRAVDKLSKGGKIFPALSNAEREKIAETNDWVIKSLWEYAGKYRKGGSNNELGTKKG